MEDQRGDQRDLARKLVDTGFLAEGLDEPVPQGNAPDPGPEADSELPRAPDLPRAPQKYRIERPIGQGGAGAVYLARDTTLNRPVALKYLRHARPTDIERFLREARFAARLDDPAIVRVYECGEVDGVPFIAMQYVEGKNLADAQLDPAGVIRAVRRVAEALAHAHAAGIVHRDIKPENILVDDAQRAYLTDFGIARDMERELGATISAEGQIMGTPALMPPEQARGDIHSVDARSDIYALGATLFTVLAQRWPFSGDNVVEVLHAVLHREPPLLRTFRPDLDRDLETIIHRCMRKKRAERYGSMAEVIAVLDQHLASGDQRPIAGAWFSAFVKSRVEGLDEPEPEPETADTESDRDWQAAVQAAQEIADWDVHLYRVRADLPRAFPRLDRLIARMDDVLSDSPACAWARFYRGAARVRRGHLDGRPDGHFELGLEDMERSIGRVRDIGSAYFELGRAYLRRHLLAHARAHDHFSELGTTMSLPSTRPPLEQAALAFAEAVRVNPNAPAWHQPYAQAVLRLAEDDAAGCAELAAAILDDDPDLEEAWKLRGEALARSGDTAGALDAYDRALDIRRSDHESHMARAALLPPDDAAEALHAALRIHPGLALAHARLARLALDRDDREAATRHTEAARGTYEGEACRAELRLRDGDPEGVLESVRTARDLPGCQNRLNYLEAQAWLARARLGGSGARDDLERILALEETEGGAQVPDNEPWRELFDAARRELA